MIDYRILSFLTLCDTMNYHQAAEQLNLSQPAVSQHIRALERELGCRLFRYDGKKLHRTAQAEILAGYARTALFNERRMRQELARPRILPVRMGATKTIGEFVIAEPLCRYLRDPDHALDITVDNTETLLWMLEHEQIDFALVEGTFDKSRYAYRLFQQAEFVGLCHESHRFAGRAVQLEELFDETVILREKGSGTRAIFEMMLQEHGHRTDRFRRTICSSNFALIGHMLQQNIGITFAYSSIARELPHVVSFHLECLPEKHEFHFVYLRGADVEPVIRAVFPSFSAEQQHNQQ